MLALAAAGAALAVAVIAALIGTRRAEDFCEDTGGPCSDAAPVRVVLLVTVTLLALVFLGALVARALSHAREPLAAFAAFVAVALSLLADM